MSSIRQSIFWSLCERHFSQIITLISSMILARLLTPEEVGIFSLCAAFLAVATIFRDFGISEYIIQEKDLTKEKLSGAYALTFLSAWMMATALYFARPYIAEFYNEPGLEDILTILCINFLILPIASPAFALLNREMNFRCIFKIQVTSTALHAVTAVALASYGFSFMSLAWASLVSIATQTLMLIYYKPEHARVLPSLAHISKPLKFGALFSSSRTIEVVKNNSHEFIISHQFGFTALGLFSRALGLINLFWQNITSAVTRVAAPSFAAAFHQSPNELRTLYIRMTTIFTGIAWPFFSFSAIEAERIIYVLFGDQWIEAAPIASILMLGTLISSITSLAPNVLIAAGEVKKRFFITLLLAPVHILGIAIASLFGLYNIAFVWILTALVGLLLYNYHLYNTLTVNFVHIFKASKPSAIIALITSTVIFGTHELFEQFPIHGFIALCIQSLLALLSWIAGIYLTQHPLAPEITRATKSAKQYLQNRKKPGSVK